MKTELDAIKEGLKSLPSGLWDFFKKVIVFSFFYGRLSFVVAVFSLGLLQLLKALCVPLDICIVIAKVVFTVGQIIPAASYIGVINEDPNCEGSTDICFSGWIIISIWFWCL